MFTAVPRAEVERGDIYPTLQQLKYLISDKAIIQKYMSALSFSIEGYEDSPKELFEIREVQKFMAELDKEFPYWFYFLSKIDRTLEFILLSVCPHYKETASGEWRVQKEIFRKFMAEHFEALEKMFSEAELPEDEKQMLRDEISTYFLRAFNLDYYPHAT